MSVGTVSNVLNQPEMVAKRTRDAVLHAITVLGYVRNESARTLRVGTSRTIGVIVLDVANPFFTDVASGVESLADERNCVINLCNSGNSIERQNRHLEVLLAQQVQGLLITPIEASSPHLERFVEQGIPVVLVDRRADGRSLCSVAVDDVLGGCLAVSHLLERGHQRIAFVGGPLSIRQVSERLHGAREAVTAAGGNPGQLVVIETPSLRFDNGRDAVEAIQSPPAAARPTAAFCANDLLALGMLQGAVRAGLQVPHELAIVGYDDIQYAEAAAVPLSSVRQPREELGRAATELLFDEMEQDHRHRQVMFQPELVIRESTVAI